MQRVQRLQVERLEAATDIIGHASNVILAFKVIFSVFQPYQVIGST